ncbi:hypothetical protein Y032_0073g781 [Ancylostoma ceylanicum]|nr:hypothetical protein Y032_0073g781 [Ancylostoma ceylanicum]
MCGPPAASASAADVPSAADDDDTPYTGGGARLRKRNELEKLRVPHMLEPTHVTLIVNGENSSAQVMTAATCAGEYLPQPPQVVSATACTSRSSVDEAASGGGGSAELIQRTYTRKVDPKLRPMTRRTSHTLLFVPEQRRVSNVSGNSVASCPCPGELGEEVDLAPLPPRFSLNLSPASSRRKSVQTGAPAIGFRPLKTFERRASQPTLQLEIQAKIIEPPEEVTDKTKMLTKRVSWLSMKSLQENEKSARRTSSPSKGGDSRTASQYGSQAQLYGERDFDSDTPPLDTLSWSNAGNEYDNVTLMYAKHEKIPMKDFGSEIRATMDIDHLLNKAVLLLDLQETSLEEIFAKIIHEMDIQEPEFTSEQVRSVLFTQDAGNQFHILSRTVQSICTTGSIGGSFDYDQTWICALCMLNTVQHRHVAIARLSHPTNLGRTMQDLRFIIIVIAPSRAKGTKTALETTRTFATLFADMEIRQRLVMAQSVEAFRSTLLSAAKELAMDQNQWRERKASIHLSQAKEQIFGPNAWYPFRGLIDEFKRRLAVYPSDFIDGVTGHRTMQKLFSTVVFLYFACLLPAIAFGVLNDDNTEGRINVRKVIIAQAIGGIFFSLFGGQPMIILLTTVPLAIYIKVISKISDELKYDFFGMYACVGLFCQLFLILYSSTELCSLMKLATRSAEEMFSLFIAIAFTYESGSALKKIFEKNYKVCAPTNSSQNSTSFLNQSTSRSEEDIETLCRRDTAILYMLLMFGTLWLGLFLYNFRKTPYLTRSRREWLADYALPASVLIMSFVGSWYFAEIEKDRFKLRYDKPIMHIANIFSLPPAGYFVCLLLGFSLSFLFFMDQNITSAIVNNPQNK